MVVLEAHTELHVLLVIESGQKNVIAEAVETLRSVDSILHVVFVTGNHKAVAEIVVL
jgi:hypothetical protein